MKEKKLYTTGEFAKKANVSVRTIHYYNDKELIHPCQVSDSGYRYYSEEEFVRLQRILTLKHLGFSLEEIQAISLNEKNNDFLRQSLHLQLDLVRKRIAHLEFMEQSIRETAEEFDKTGQVDWEAMIGLMKLVDMEKDLVEQYKNGKNIKSRINLHEKYANNVFGWFPWIMSNIEKDEIRDVLEIGCGDGTFWSVCAGQIPKGWKLTLSDVSRGMLEDAVSNLEKMPGERTFIVADCQKLPLEDNCMDIVIANHVLFYPKNIRAAVSEIFRVLRPGGVLYCTTYGCSHMKEVEQLVQEFDEEIVLSRVKLYENFGLENGESVLREFFDEVEQREYPDYLEVTEVEPLLDYILSCHGNQREKLLSRYEDFKRFLQKKMKKKGFVKITKQAGMFICRKRGNV